MKILGFAWFNNISGCIGVVLSENSIGEKKGYIAKVAGFDEEHDIKFVRDWGSEISVEAAESMIKQSGTLKPSFG